MPPTLPRPVGKPYGPGLCADLVGVTLDLIEAEGADHVSLRAVAGWVGVSPTAVAHHFGDKEGLFTAIALGGFQLLTNQVNSTPTLPSEPSDPVGALAWLYADFAARHPARFEVMSQPALIRSADRRVAAAEAELFLSFAVRIEASKREGWRTDQDTASHVIAAWSLAHGYCALRQGSLARQLRSTPPPDVEQLVAVVAAAGRRLR